jgi:hypothetical protein
MLAAGCSEPPQKEIDQAQAAVNLARTGGAEIYAAEEYTAAAVGVQKAHTAVNQRDYRQALSYAIDARQRAQSALRQASEGKGRAQRAAEITMAAASTQLTQLEARLTAAETAKVPAKELRGPRTVLADARKGLQEARTEIGAENYARAVEIITAVRKNLDEGVQDVENIPRSRPRSSRKR